MEEEATVDDVARWMLEYVEKHGQLHQQRAVHEIRDRFGEQFLPRSERSGYPVIRPDVLQVFRAISEEHVVWSKSGRLWRVRQEGDPPTGRQVP